MIPTKVTIEYTEADGFIITVMDRMLYCKSIEDLRGTISAIYSMCIDSNEDKD